MLSLIYQQVKWIWKYWTYIIADNTRENYFTIWEVGIEFILIEKSYNYWSISSNNYHATSPRIVGMIDFSISKMNLKILITYHSAKIKKITLRYGKYVMSSYSLRNPMNKPTYIVIFIIPTHPEWLIFLISQEVKWIWKYWSYIIPHNNRRNCFMLWEVGIEFILIKDFNNDLSIFSPNYHTTSPWLVGILDIITFEMNLKIMITYHSTQLKR